MPVTTIARAMMLQPDGKIVVVGACDNNFCVRYLTDASTASRHRRTSQRTRASTTLTAYSCGVAADGKIVVVVAAALLV